MPVYEYKCISCGARYDVFHRGRELAADIACPACSSKEYKKLMSAPAALATKESASSGDSCDAGGCSGGGMCGMN